MAEWMSSDLSELDLLVIQIDGMRVSGNLLMTGAPGIDRNGVTHAPGVVEGATENAAAAQALPDSLVERGLDPQVPRLFIVDGAKALSKAIRQTFGADAAIQRCQVHKARNITDRLDAKFHGSVRHALRQAWKMDGAEKAERLLRNPERRLKTDAPGASASIEEGIDEILAVIRLGLPLESRRSLAGANGIESMRAVVRNACGNVKRRRDARMALRWTAAGMLEARKGFRRLKACRRLHILENALERHRNRNAGASLDHQAKAAQP